MTIPCDFEPYRVKTVEPIQITTLQQRRQFLRDAEFNLFRLRSEQVMIDLITDSGTGAMSSAQWAAIMRGEESFAGSSSFHRLAETVLQCTGIANVLPTHQGRVAERLLVEAAIGKAPAGEGLIVPNNAHFDTTRSMIQASGAQTINLLCDGADQLRPNKRSQTLPADCAFLGNMDVRKLERLLQERSERVPFVMLTLTCNSNGGQPVSLENLRAVRAVCDRFGKLLILDACRFAENAFFIQQRELGQKDRSIASIVRETFDVCDGATLSARKDLLMNVGGLLLLRDDHLHRKASNLCVLTEGFQMTFGSLPGRDLEAMAVGLTEAVNPMHLSSRIEAVSRLAKSLTAAGIEIIQPVGAHAVYIDAEAFCPHLRREENPAQALACALYESAGIRCSRIGSVMCNLRGEPMELVRLAIPRRTYTQAHLEYVASAVIDLKSHAAQIQSVPGSLPARILCAEPEFQAA